MAKKREEWLGADPVKMSDEDFAKIQSNSDAWFSARERGDQAAMDALHEDSERIRAKYGYSGGEAGIDYNKLPEGETYTYASPSSRPSSYKPQYAQELQALTQQTAPTYTSKYADQLAALTGKSAPAYQSQYDSQIAALLGQTTPAYQSKYDSQIAALLGQDAPTYTSRYDEQLAALQGQSAPAYQSRYGAELEEMTRALLSRDPFSYDPNTDPQYAAYRKEYAREGQRAAADTLGQYAAMTGGMPSTAAITASQQAGNYYGAKMADVIPQLYQAAYQMYQDEGNRQVRDINAMRQLENDAYTRYLNDRNQFNEDRNFNYNLLSQLENNDYNRYADQLNQWNANRNFDYSVLNQLENNAYNRYINGVNQANVDRNFDYSVLNQLENNNYNRYINDVNRFNTDRAFDYSVLNQLDQNDREDYRTALNQWNADRSFNAGIYNQLEADAYDQWADSMNQWNADRAFEYGQQRDAVEDARYADETAYNRALTEDELAYQRYRDQVGDARALDQDTYNRMLDAAKLGAAYGDFSGLNALGITPDAAELLRYELAGAGRVTPVGSGTGGSSGSGSESSKGAPTPDWDAVRDYVAQGGKAEDYVKANAKAWGYSSASDAVAAWNVADQQDKWHGAALSAEAEDERSRNGDNLGVSNTLLNSMKQMVHGGASATQILDRLDQYVKAGTLTPSQRDAIIVYFGLD